MKTLNLALLGILLFSPSARAETSLVAFRLESPWGNDFHYDDALAQPLTGITIRAARNSRAFFVFGLANPGERPYLGQVKVFDRGPEAYGFNKEYTTGIARHFTVRKGVEIAAPSGSPLWDPLVPLPMGTLLEIPSGDATPIWLDVDTRGLAAGRHAVVLLVKRGRPGFSTLSIPVTVEIEDLDLAETCMDRVCYNYMTAWPQNRNFTGFLVGRDFNVIYMGAPGQDHLKIYNRYDAKGSLVPGDMAPIDRIVDAHLAAGMDLSRVKLWFYLAFDVGFSPGNAGAVFGEKWTAAMRAFLEQLVMHVGERYGITADRIILYPYDEPEGDVDDPSTEMNRAFRMATLIKGFGRGFKLMTNIHPSADGELWEKTVTKFSECYDIIEFFRPGLTAERIAFVKALPFKDVWTYDIRGKTSLIRSYRADYWQNMRDGFCGVSAYWHMDEMTGGDGLCSTDSREDGQPDSDYGSIYVDFNFDGVMLSRRQVAGDLGFEEARLVRWLRQHTDPSSRRRCLAESVVRSAAEATSMVALDAYRDALLDLAANGFLPLDWISSAGQAYIDTGIANQAGLIADIRSEWLVEECSDTSSGAVFGAVEANPPLSCYLFACNDDGHPAGRLPMKLYSAKIYTNENVLAREYVPALHGETGVYGLFERVSKTFVPAAEGSFGGPRVDVEPMWIDIEPQIRPADVETDVRGFGKGRRFETWWRRTSLQRTPQEESAVSGFSILIR